ncbi:uncharacterized protein METZ01_LOCUS501738, partial [marine metagenome]
VSRDSARLQSFDLGAQSGEALHQIRVTPIELIQVGDARAPFGGETGQHAGGA